MLPGHAGISLEKGLGRGYVLIGLRPIPLPRRNPRLCVLPSELPQIFPLRRDVGLFKPRVVSCLIPLVSRIQVAVIDADARRFVGHLALLVRILRTDIVFENHLLVIHGLPAVAAEGPRHGHGALGVGLGHGIGRGVDGLLEILARLVAFAHQVQQSPGRDVRRERIRSGFQIGPIQRPGLVQFAFPDQLLALPDEFGLIPAKLRRLCENKPGQQHQQYEVHLGVILACRRPEFQGEIPGCSWPRCAGTAWGSCARCSTRPTGLCSGGRGSGRIGRSGY